MSYEKVRSIGLRQNELGHWIADITSASSNCTPLYYEKWVYGGTHQKYETKEDLIKDVLLDFYLGNFHNGLGTKYGKFMNFLGGHWGCNNPNSQACKTYHFYDKLRNQLNSEYRTKCYLKGHTSFDTKTEEYKKFEETNNKLTDRLRREVKNKLYKEFVQFNSNQKYTISFINGGHREFVTKVKKNGTIIYNSNKIEKLSNNAYCRAITTLENNNLKYEVCEV